MKQERGPDNAEEGERLKKLADELDVLQREKMGAQGDGIIQKLVQRLRNGDAYSAKVFCGNEVDKFTKYRKDGILLIIEKLYGGRGSPWFTVERELQGKQSSAASEPQK